jgi:hypothetical protein
MFEIVFVFMVTDVETAPEGPNDESNDWFCLLL